MGRIGRWMGRIGGPVFRVSCLSLVGDLGLQTITIVHVVDGLFATVWEVHRVAALSLVAVADLRVAEVDAGVAIRNTVVVGVFGRNLR